MYKSININKTNNQIKKLNSKKRQDIESEILVMVWDMHTY